MPVYNEEGAIEGVLRDWLATLDGLAIDYQLRVYDDGSRDGTRAIIERMAAANRRVISTTHTNRGHGPTLMRAYGDATGEWVFQTDSDGEMPASAFPQLWRARGGRDVIVGVRTGRQSSLDRRLLSAGSRGVVRLLFGRGFSDVNSPFRLMRGDWLRAEVAKIPEDAAAPNVILAGLAARSNARIHELPVPHHARRSGRSSINLRRLLTLGLSATAQTLLVAAGFYRR